MLTATVLACSHYLGAVRDEVALPLLDDPLRAACRKPYRRIDRFVQLALIGSARCALRAELRPDCGVYLGSTHGPLTSIIRVHQQMLRDRELPKPFNFVNTLGSIAAFYVADNLQLNGPSLFVSRHARSLEAVLEAALTDLAFGAVEQALVGVVEEVPLPFADQRRRLRVADDAVLGEGSHWMLLAASSAEDSSRSISLQRFADGETLESCFGAEVAASTTVGLGRDLGQRAVLQVRCHFPHAIDIAVGPTPFHGSLEAAWFADQIASVPEADVTLVNGDGADGCLLHSRTT